MPFEIVKFSVYQFTSYLLLHGWFQLTITYFKIQNFYYRTLYTQATLFWCHWFTLICTNYLGGYPKQTVIRRNMNQLFSVGIFLLSIFSTYFLLKNKAFHVPIHSLPTRFLQERNTWRVPGGAEIPTQLGLLDVNCLIGTVSQKKLIYLGGNFGYTYVV